MIIRLFDAIIRRENILGINPNKGGSPPNDKNRAIRDILIFGGSAEKELVCGTNFIDIIEKASIIGVNEAT